MTRSKRAVRPLPRARHLVLLGAALVASLLPLAAPAKSPPQAWDGLERRPSKSLDHVYVRPGVQFTAYRRVRLDPINVEFDKNWDPNRGSRQLSQRLSKSDVQRLRGDLAASFAKVLGETLAKGGYPLVEEDDDDVLRVTASLVNVYVSAPGKAAAETTHTFVMEAGSITLFMELRDSVTGQVLARAVDTTEGPTPGHLQWASSVSNSAAAQQAFTAWAARLKRALDVVNGKDAGK